MAVVIPIVSEFDGKGLSRAIKEFQQLEGAGEKAQFALKKAAIPAAAALAGVAVAVTDMTKAAIEDEKAQLLLAQAIEKNTLAGKAAVAGAEAYIEATMMSAAVADDQLRPALAQLVQTTGSLEYSQTLLNTALDVSAATGTDLATVTDAMSKAAVGNMKALGNLVPAVRETIKEGASLDQVMQILSASMGGAATIAANSAEGQMKKLSLTISETKESIGAAFLPILERLLPKLQQFAMFIQQNTGLVTGLIIAVGALSAAILVANAAIKVITVAQLALNFAMAANPIGLVITAVALLVAGFLLLVKTTGGVKEAFIAMGNFIIGVFENIVNSFNNMLNLIIKGINMLPGVQIPFIPKLELPRIPGGSSAAVGTGSGTTSGPDLLERALMKPTLPEVPAVVVAPIKGVGGGGGTRGKAGGGLGKGMVGILPIGDGFSGGGGGGIGGGTGNEMTLLNDTGGVTVVVNAAIAEATLADKIVDALTDYNRRSGPLQLAIA
jgi:hypothetical protein